MPPLQGLSFFNSDFYTDAALTGLKRGVEYVGFVANTTSKNLYSITRPLVHRLTLYATRETQTKSLYYNFNQKWYKFRCGWECRSHLGEYAAKPHLPAWGCAGCFF